LVAEYEDLERALEKAENKAVDSLAGDGTAEIVDRMDALEAEMRESVETFTLRALPHRRTPGDDRPTWTELEQRHPPRRDDNNEVLDDDKGPGFNTETFYDDLIRLCTVSPEMDDEDWDTLLSVLSEGQFAQFSLAASMLNRAGVDIPLSRAALRAKRRTSAE
jgi:hypothetical protein